MYRYFIFLILLLSCMVLSCQAQGKAELGVTLTWQLKGGETGEKVFPSVALSSLDGKGLWVAFKKDGEESYPGIAVGGKFLPTDVPLQEIASLELEVTVREGGATRLKERSVLFSDKRHFGSLEASPENVYHLLVLNDFVDSSALPSTLGEGVAPAPEWKEPFFRTHRLAMNYAVQSDEKTHQIANGLKVKTRYDLPRLILVAEELIVFTVETEAQQGQSGGGLFGVDLEGMMDGEDQGSEKQKVIKKIPTYSIDVMNDTIEAEGKYSAGFQNGRSLWNDILEGKVIYEASKGERQVVTATIVFSQMEKNIAARGSDNRILSIDATNTEELDTCEQLWPSVKADIAGFLRANPEWNVIIPQKPVRFYEDEKPLYDLYAWYRVHPQSGRMIGMLPDGTRGGHGASLELERIKRAAQEGVNAAEKEKQEEQAQEEKEAQKDPYAKTKDKAKEKAQDAAKNAFEKHTGAEVPSTSALMRFQQQIAGMYVAAGGVLEGVTMTFCDPTIAALGQQEWLEFLSKHSLDFCEKFIEDHAYMYDDYATMFAFWQGAVIIPCSLSGEEACKYAAQKAIKGATKKAVKDAEEWIDEKTGMKRAKEIEEGIDAAKEIFGVGS